MAEQVATTLERDVLRFEVRVEAKPETIFDFFTDPEKMTRWMGTEAELDPTPGGTFRVKVNPQAVASGAYVEIDRPRRVVFTWGWEPSGDGPHSAVAPGSSTVEVSLEPDGEATVVTMLHKDLPSDEMRTAHTQGWVHYLGRLAVAGIGDDPGPDPMAEVSAP